MTNSLRKMVNDVRNNAGGRKKTNTADSKDSSRSDDTPKEEEKKPEVEAKSPKKTNTANSKDSSRSDARKEEEKKLEVEAKGPSNPPDSSKIQGSSLYGLVLPDEHSNKTLYLRDASGVEFREGLREIPPPPATRVPIALPRRGGDVLWTSEYDQRLVQLVGNHPGQVETVSLRMGVEASACISRLNQLTGSNIAGVKDRRRSSKLATDKFRKRYKEKKKRLVQPKKRKLRLQLEDSK
ncbi:OLC1v1017768C1 [Oldenlandia corymbosa var. corymbosa]|uniref:OLC1v1017768C1 n=1 Tax=Oldenlandia corymbosa var. corymbosa TaxID=529605 RepID=A0AAV1EA70_OLDCO|nr:OLC1v1017768C1 [Oldenlandia corymbosa var. corymbosa]